MGAYGGSKLVQIVNEHGGVRDVLPHLGYTSKREVAAGIRSFLIGRFELEDEQRRGIACMKTGDKVECWNCGKTMTVPSDNNNLWTNLCLRCCKKIAGGK
jgi:hypothetical protein